MTWHAFDADGWYTGPAPADSAGATPIPPPLGNVLPVNGMPRARWRRTRWEVAPYLPRAAKPWAGAEAKSPLGALVAILADRGVITPAEASAIVQRL